MGRYASAERDHHHERRTVQKRRAESMDGRMLVDAFDSAFVQQHPVQYEETSAVSLGERESSSTPRMKPRWSRSASKHLATSIEFS